MSLESIKARLDASGPTNDTRRTASSQLFALNAVSYLKEHRGSVSLQTLSRLYSTTFLFDKCFTEHPNVRYNSADSTYEYVPKHSALKNVLLYINDNYPYGLALSEILDVRSTILSEVQQYVNDDAMIAIRTVDLPDEQSIPGPVDVTINPHEIMLYPRTEADLECKVADSTRELWESIKTPARIATINQVLQKAGHACQEDETKLVARKALKEKARKRSKKKSITTNTHMIGKLSWLVDDL